MNKLLKWKEWVTIKEAATHISTLVEESVSVADIYQFALDEHLTLSVNFINPMPIKLGSFIKESEVEAVQQQRGLNMGNLTAPEIVDKHFSNGTCVRISNRLVSYTSGIFDLMMVENSKRYIQSLFESMHSNVSVKMNDRDSLFLSKNDLVYVPQTPINKSNRFIDPGSTYDSKQFRDAQTLDSHDCALVIRTEELNRFVQSLTNKPKSKTAITKEKDSILTMLAAVCSECNFDYRDSKVNKIISINAGLLGPNLDVGTVRKYLKELNEYIPFKTKEELNSLSKK